MQVNDFFFDTFQLCTFVPPGPRDCINTASHPRPPEAKANSSTGQVGGPVGSQVTSRAETFCGLVGCYRRIIFPRVFYGMRSRFSSVLLTFTVFFGISLVSLESLWLVLLSACSPPCALEDKVPGRHLFYETNATHPGLFC